MTRWPDRRILDLFGIALRIIQALMAGATTVNMVVAPPANRRRRLGASPDDTIVQ
nr:hypothetical protein [Rhizobium tubonense]